MSSSSSQDYAGDIAVAEAWALLSTNPRAQLIDVRCQAEWHFVGRADLSSLEQPGEERAHCVEWLAYPQMQPNPDFVAQAREVLDEAGADTDTPILFLCRSGARSRAAAAAMTRAGYARAYNVASGFEGDLDVHGHRGSTAGWKAAGLPWRQS